MTTRPRPTGMRVTVAALMMVLMVAGCSDGDPPSAAPGASSGTPGVSSGSAGAPGSGGPGPGGPGPGPTATPPQPSGTGEIQEGLPGPERTLTGMVERVGGCTVLIVGSRQWALAGPMAEGLPVGTRMTIVGPLTAVPGECARLRSQATQAIVVSRAAPA